MGVVEDYGELYVQFGLATLFVGAFPLAPFIAFVSNFVEVKVDGFKLLYGKRRPVPCGCEDIGAWQSMFSLLALCSVSTNAGVMVFTMDVLPPDITEEPNRKVWIFFIIQYCVVRVCLRRRCRRCGAAHPLSPHHAQFAVTVFMAVMVPDVAAKVDTQLQRRKYIVDKIVYGLADEDDPTEDPEYEEGTDDMGEYPVPVLHADLGVHDPQYLERQKARRRRRKEKSGDGKKKKKKKG